MQWSQIKTLFILCFLILNIYLFVEFMDKQSSIDSYDRTNPNEPTLEEELKQENIKIRDYHIDVKKDTYMNIAPKKYTETDYNKIKALKNQETELINGSLLVSRFDEPIPMPKQPNNASVSQLLKKYIASSDGYKYYGWDKDANVLLLFQKNKDRTIYYNRYGLILVFLNEDNEMIYYTQTMLGDAQEQGEPSTLYEPMSAIGTLFDQNELYSKDTITDVEYGYYTRIASETGASQVFAPTYKITVNEERNYFVGAVEPYVSMGDNTKFLSDTLQNYESVMQQMSNEIEWKKEFLIMVNQIIAEDSIENNRSDFE
ncbi:MULTISPECIES: two-component system regulatory protein YycI [Virgibacillus]|uniref:Two-component system regulatory protein YycI n=1 Tax=Virgibacillus dokdonensis TaxID=302167 RepID=A0ABU7VC15_9BACI|nr:MULTISPECIES: two-component system regulatory protein YycI [Virgibacillus]NWO13087.1 two-component system regulatory protein YycI [Virgibacillus sp.]